MSFGHAIVIVTVVNVILYKDYFYDIQYTKNAFLWAATGGVFLIDGIIGDSNSDLIIGSILSLFGLLIRDKCWFFIK